MSSRFVASAVVLAVAASLATRLEAGQDSAAKKPSVVRLVKEGDSYQLLRDGRPYFIKGAGGSTALKALAAAGGNSLRTWGADNFGPLLDEAHGLGLSVTVGLWLGHERHGFNYNDAEQVARQSEDVARVVRRYKDHPAVLLWGVGNEMEGLYKGDNAAVWSAVNNVAALVKKIDPNHPTMTVVAEIGGDRVKNLHRLCPDVDIVGVNSYAGAATLPRRYREAGGIKPYVLAEFGPHGSWEVGKNAWGVPVEPTSTEKAGQYRKAYEAAVLGAGGLCLGSYAFIWGHKQEGTATWFGMLLPDGSRLAAVDVMTELWTGKPPAGRCPRIDSLKLAGSGEEEPGATVRATLSASGPEKDASRVTWVLQREPWAGGAGGDTEEVPPTFPEAIVKGDARGAAVRLPKEGGGYRLFAYVRDGRGGAAVANVPLRVKGPVVAPKGRKVELPLVVYDEASRERPAYVPTGWMGNHKAVRLTPDAAEEPHAGKTCLKVEYGDKDGWAGVVWQSPANDWGERPGGCDLTGAKKLTFWARGAGGGKAVNFELGLIAKDKPFPDTGHAKLEGVKLTKAWKQYAIDLGGQDLTRIKTGFCCVWSGQGGPLTFYLDDVRYE